MGLEAVTYISDLVITNPVGLTDPKSEGDDHIRNIKKALKNTFPNLTGAMNVSQADLNGFFTTGNLMLWQQGTAPTGWTKQTTHNDKCLRVVSGTPSSGGATAFSSVFGSGKSSGSYTLQVADIPSHTHTASVTDPGHVHHMQTGNSTPGGGNFAPSTDANFSLNSTSSDTTGVSVTNANTGGGGGHSHTLSLDLQYVDLIIASKN